MFKKGKKFYADWRGSDGKRLRKAFTSASEALAYEETRRVEAKNSKLRSPLGITPEPSSPPSASHPETATAPPSQKSLLDTMQTVRDAIELGTLPALIALVRARKTGGAASEV